MEKEEINPGHYLELMDRTHIIMENINTHLLEHPLTLNDLELTTLYNDAIDTLWKAYQLVGQKDDSYEI